MAARKRVDQTHLSVEISPFHVKQIDHRVEEQGISRSEAVRQIIRDASLGRFGVVVPAVQEIHRAVARLRRSAPGNAEVAAAVDQIERAARSLIDG